MAHSYEAHFGPASDPIDIVQFIRDATELETQAPVSIPMFSTSPRSVAGFEAMIQLPEDYKDSIAEECGYVHSHKFNYSSNRLRFDSVTDIQSSIEEVLTDPTLYAHITKAHDTNVYLIHDHADTSGRRKRKRPGFSDPVHEDPAVTALRKTLDNVQLRSWQYVFDLISLEFNTNAMLGLCLTPHFSCVHLRTQIKMCLPPSRNQHHWTPLCQPIPQLPLHHQKRS